MMEVLGLEISIPLLHLSLFVVIVSICFLFERSTLGLFTAFVFVYNWASYVNRELLTDLLAQSETYPWMFYGGFAALVFLSGLGLLSSRRLD
jgi:hypothetical protein